MCVIDAHHGAGHYIENSGGIHFGVITKIYVMWSRPFLKIFLRELFI